MCGEREEEGVRGRYFRSWICVWPLQRPSPQFGAECCTSPPLHLLPDADRLQCTMTDQSHTLQGPIEEHVHTVSHHLLVFWTAQLAGILRLCDLKVS